MIASPAALRAGSFLVRAGAARASFTPSGLSRSPLCPLLGERGSKRYDAWCVALPRFAGDRSAMNFFAASPASVSSGALGARSFAGWSLWGGKSAAKETKKASEGAIASPLATTAETRGAAPPSPVAPAEPAPARSSFFRFGGEAKQPVHAPAAEPQFAKPEAPVDPKKGFSFNRIKAATPTEAPTPNAAEKQKKRKVPFFARLRSFLCGFLVASGGAFYILYYQLEDATARLHILAKDAAYRMATVENKLHALEKKLERDSKSEASSRYGMKRTDAARIEVGSPVAALSFIYALQKEPSRSAGAPRYMSTHLRLNRG
ncbi:hypothetical protein BESB_074080 [Besnoitia besnoiti]|uniref:Transmembrane protein n=1 Tax=Besnoitia besnoiti TaxID=94643 RepID=A0A2A9ME80_BESBE|nr:uncharacterized protein BESB_074080 [Besnoitia besnoiti]PFH34256.1 hypothetical protein BESB_074080 [Besnoitia besnoiti]